MLKDLLMREQNAQKQVHEHHNTPIFGTLYWLIGLPVALLLFAFFVYYPSLHYAFQFDDNSNIIQFYAIRHKTFWDLFFTNARWLGYWVNTIHYHMACFDPFQYRLGNVLFHCLTGLLVFWATALMLRRRTSSFYTRYYVAIAAMAAGLFLLHPVQTQTVSYVIQGQLEGLAGLCTMAMIVCFLLLVSARRQVAYVSLFALLCVITLFACGAKEIAIVSPLLLLLVDWFFVAQGCWSNLWSRKFIHGTVVAIVGGLYVYTLGPKFFQKAFGLSMEVNNNMGNLIADVHTTKISALHFLISQFKVILHYIWIFFFPFHLSVDYDWVLSKSFLAPDSLFPFLFLCALVAVAIWRFRKNSVDIVVFCIAWFFVTILPRSSIIPSGELVADYKTYLASFGVVLLMATAVVKLISYMSEHMQRPHRAHLVTLGLLCMTLGFSTYERNKVWESAQSFWMNIIMHAPSKARAYNNYAAALINDGKAEDSIWYLRKAIALDQYYPDPCNNLSLAYAKVGKYDAATKALERTMYLQPDYPEPYNNLGSFFIDQGQYAEAEPYLRKAIELRPHYGNAYMNLSKMYRGMGDMDNMVLCARQCCTQADLDNDKNGFAFYGMVSMEAKCYDDAIFAFSKLAEHAPEHSYEAHFNIANAYYASGDVSRAQREFETLIKHNSDDWRVLYNLGEVYFAQADFEQALGWYHKSIEHKAHPSAVLHMAACYGELGQLDQAAYYANQLLAASEIPSAVHDKARTILHAVRA
jgi:tetratricopeptide (TPR) repeat protein